MIDADHHDHIVFGQKAICFQLMLFGDQNILLVLGTHVHLVQSFELADAFKVRLGMGWELIKTAISCQLLGIGVHAVDTHELIHGLPAHHEVLDFFQLYKNQSLVNKQ